MDTPVKSVAWIKFEDDVFTHVQAWLKGGRLSVNPYRATAYRKRSYFSVRREANIEFEISIEAHDEGATEPSLVWLWECKDHSRGGRAVEVSDVEILNDKVDQLGRARFKASLVTTHGFQSGAEALAKSCGISLFVLKKELHRVLMFSNEAARREHWRELIALSSGNDSSGHPFTEDTLLETALVRCFDELGFPTRSDSLGAIAGDTATTRTELLVREFMHDQHAKGQPLRIDLKQNSDGTMITQVISICGCDGDRPADKVWICNQLHCFLLHRGMRADDEAVAEMHSVLIDVLWREP